MTLQDYVNVVLAAIGTVWGLVWLTQALASLRRDIAHNRESRLREFVTEHCPGIRKAEDVTRELRTLEAYLGIRYESYNKELRHAWFDSLPNKPTYRSRP